MSADYAHDLFSYMKKPPCEDRTTGLKLPARHDDPLSSKLAAADVERDGTRRHQIEAITAIVRLHPGHTSMELSRLTGLDRYLIARRLPEAEALNLVWREAKLKRCAISGKLALTWQVRTAGCAPRPVSDASNIR